MAVRSASNLATYDFVSPPTGTKATGSVALSNSAPEDGDTVQLTDALGNTRTFEFDASGDGVTSGNVAVTFASTRDEAVNALAQAVRDEPLAIDGVADTSTDTVDLIQVMPVAEGNTSVVATWNTPANVTANDFTGGQGSFEDRELYSSTHGYQQGDEPATIRNQVALAAPLILRVQEGGVFDFTFENASGQLDDGVDLSYSLEVSPDGITYYSATGAAAPPTFSAYVAGADTDADPGVSINAGVNSRTVSLVLHPSAESYVRVWTTGGGRMRLHVTNDGRLDPVIMNA